jgi:hypothetical protein
MIDSFGVSLRGRERPWRSNACVRAHLGLAPCPSVRAAMSLREFDALRPPEFHGLRPSANYA